MKYGYDVGGLKLGKEFLVSRLQVLLQTRRVRLPESDEARVLADELRDYEIRVDEHARVTAGAMKTGAHDDLATALGLAVLEDRFKAQPRIDTVPLPNVMKGIMEEQW